MSPIFPLTYLTNLERTERARASQYAFIVTTKPASKASQSNCGTTLGAANNKAIVRATLANSQNRRLAMAEPECCRRVLRNMPRTHNSEGSTTANAP